MLDTAALNAVKTTDANFLDLRAIANDSGIMDVVTASGSGKTGFYYQSREQVIAEAAKFGVPVSEVTGPDSYLGQTSGRPDRVLVIVSDGIGAAAGAPLSELARSRNQEGRSGNPEARRKAILAETRLLASGFCRTSVGPSDF